MNQADFELHMAMKESYSHKMCSVLHTAIRFQFPKIKGLDVFYDDEYEMCIVFEEDENVSKKEIDDFIEDLKIKKGV